MSNSPYCASADADVLHDEVSKRFQLILSEAGVPYPQWAHFKRWVARWLAELDGQEPPRNAAKRFAEGLANADVPEWQCRQAMRAVECWLEAQDGILVGEAEAERPEMSWGQILVELERKLRVQQYSARTIEVYMEWSRRLALYAPDVPQDGDEISAAVQGYLRKLALAHNLSYATVAQARNALAWMVRNIMGLPLVLEARGGAHRPKRIPHVIADVKVRKLLDNCKSPWDLFFGLQYGCGLRLMELLELRVQDIDLERGILTVRHGKGDRDRQALIPQVLRDRTREHLEARRALWKSDINDGFAKVDLPAPSGRVPRVSTDWEWQHVFGAAQPLRHPGTGELRRWRPLETVVRQKLREAADRAGILGRVHPHLLRHCFATHLLEAGVPIQQIQEQLGHANLQTTMIYLHVRSPVEYAKSPLDLEPSAGFGAESRRGVVPEGHNPGRA